MRTIRFSTQELLHDESSDAVEFIVLLDFSHTFIRVLAHYQAGAVLGGTAPTFLIKAGVHDPTPCPAGGATKILGSGGRVVAEATVERDDDTYLVTIEHQAPSGPWSVAVRNEESLPLSFFGFIAVTAEKTCQPWLVLLDGLTLGGESAGFGPTKDGLNILNVGTAPLTVFDGFHVGDRLGPTQSPVTIVSLPGPIHTHRIGTVVVQCPRLEPYVGGEIVTLPSPLPSNDPNPVNITIRLVHPVLYPSYCRKRDGCIGFDGQPDEYGGFYYCNCSHTKYDHNILDDPPPDGPVY